MVSKLEDTGVETRDDDVAEAEQVPAEEQIEETATEEAAEDVAADAEEAEQAAVDEPAKADEPAIPEAVEVVTKPATNIGDLVIVGILSIILGVLLALPMFLSGQEEKAKVEAAAATVNGVVIKEGAVTDLIAGLRATQQLESDEAWGQWLVDSGSDPQKIRDTAIETLVQQELINQAAAEQGVEVSDEDVESTLAEMKEQIGGDEAFVQLLEAQGMTEEDIRSSMNMQLKAQGLAEKIAGGAEADDAEVLEIIKTYYADQVEGEIKTLDDVDPELVEYIRTQQVQSQINEKYLQWMNDYEAKAQIEKTAMPEGLPYAVDLSGIKASSQLSMVADEAGAAQLDAADEAESPEPEAMPEEAAPSDSAAAAEK